MKINNHEVVAFVDSGMLGLESVAKQTYLSVYRSSNVDTVGELCQAMRDLATGGRALLGDGRGSGRHGEDPGPNSFM